MHQLELFPKGPSGNGAGLDTKERKKAIYLLEKIVEGLKELESDFAGSKEDRKFFEMVQEDREYFEKLLNKVV